MKKTAVSFITAMALVAFMGPTEVQGQSLMLGVKGGVNVSDIDVQEDLASEVTDAMTGFVGGGFVQLGLGTLGVRVEGLYSQRGSSDVDGDLSVDYIEIPILAVFKLLPGPARPYLFAGPVASFEVGCEIAGGTGGISASADCIDASIETESLEAGLAFGAGVEFDAGGLTLLVDGRYNLGLTNLDASEDTDSKNRTWSIMGGLGFGIG